MEFKIWNNTTMNKVDNNIGIGNCSSAIHTGCSQCACVSAAPGFLCYRRGSPTLHLHLPLWHLSKEWERTAWHCEKKLWPPSRRHCQVMYNLEATSDDIGCYLGKWEWVSCFCVCVNTLVVVGTVSMCLCRLTNSYCCQLPPLSRSVTRLQRETAVLECTWLSSLFFGCCYKLWLCIPGIWIWRSPCIRGLQPMATLAVTPSHGRCPKSLSTKLVKLFPPGLLVYTTEKPPRLWGWNACVFSITNGLI